MIRAVSLSYDMSSAARSSRSSVASAGVPVIIWPFVASSGSLCTVLGNRTATECNQRELMSFTVHSRLHRHANRRLSCVREIEAAPDSQGFGDVLGRWRVPRRMTKQALAAIMGFDRSYISHVESGRHPASADFARKAESALNAGGEVWNAWQATSGAAGEQSVITAPGSDGLIVEHDHAELRYDGRLFTAAMRRRIVNTGPDPVTRYLVRISVDRFPGEPEASNRLYRQHPLTFDELGLTAHCDGEPMAWKVKLDRDSFKEVWLCFENEQSRYPLYPGEHATLEYAYTVGD